MNKEDICAHLGDEYHRYLGAIAPPIFQNSLFTRKEQSHGYVYTRIANPTIEIAEKKLAALEGGEAARCFSSGMAAISAAIMQTVSKDGHVVCVRSVYGPVRQFLSDYLSRFGVETTYVDGCDPADFERAVRPETNLVYLESPVSNVFTLQDLQAVADFARSRGILTVVDNTWATPMQNPLAFGIDMVVHSASKYLGGHSDIIGGAVIGKQEVMEAMTHNERALFGAVMDPHQAWLLIRGLRTLPLRMKQHQESAMAIASFLERHPKIERVLYPGLTSHPQAELGRRQMTGYSGLLSFIPKGDPDAVLRCLKGLRYFEEGPSWGGYESLFNTPGLGIDAATSQETGIPQGLVRISVGLEHTDSLLEDLDRALHGLE